MKETASLTAIDHIYNHYSESYGALDSSGVLDGVASGHRRWAIRESFGSIDNVFNEERQSQVDQEADELFNLLKAPIQDSGYFPQVAVYISSLLVDSRVREAFRRNLWPIYETLRHEPQSLTSADSTDFVRFCDYAKIAVDEWNDFLSASIEDSLGE